MTCAEVKLTVWLSTHANCRRLHWFVRVKTANKTWHVWWVPPLWCHLLTSLMQLTISCQSSIIIYRTMLISTHMTAIIAKYLSSLTLLYPSFSHSSLWVENFSQVFWKQISYRHAKCAITYTQQQWLNIIYKVRSEKLQAKKTTFTHFSFVAYSISMAHFSFTKCRILSQNSVPFCVWVRTLSNWSWKSHMTTIICQSNKIYKKSELMLMRCETASV